MKYALLALSAMFIILAASFGYFVFKYWQDSQTQKIAFQKQIEGLRTENETLKKDLGSNLAQLNTKAVNLEHNIKALAINEIADNEALKNFTIEKFSEITLKMSKLESNVSSLNFNVYGDYSGIGMSGISGTVLRLDYTVGELESDVSMLKKFVLTEAVIEVAQKEGIPLLNLKNAKPIGCIKKSSLSGILDVIVPKACGWHPRLGWSATHLGSGIWWVFGSIEYDGQYGERMTRDVQWQYDDSKRTIKFIEIEKMLNPR